MAVPASGTLTMLGIAQERKFSTYGSGVFANPILMTDLINGGGLNAFPPLNYDCTPRPNTSTPHSMSEWYGYDQDCAPPAVCEVIELRYTSQYRTGGDACFADAVEVFTTDVKRWYVNQLFADGDCKEGVYAASGAYSDGTTWAVWDGKSGQWTDQGFCFQ